ncbi:hypothetical protein Bca4012_057944 [Brassica carinata]
MASYGAPSNKSLSKIACKRLQKELVEWQMNPPTGFKYKVTDDLQRWIIEVIGAPGTLYANETYQLQVDFPEHYPMESPQHEFPPIGDFSSSSSSASSHLQQWAYLLSDDSEFYLHQHPLHAL